MSVIPRVIAALGFKPALLIQDSFSYMKQSVQLLPLSELRPAGYPLVLHLLQPFHSLLLVTTVQHLMGIALGVIIYAVLRGRGLPAWGATLAAVPTLFDSRQIWLESSILPDTLFTLVLMIAVAILVVRPRPTIWQAVIVGLLVSWASVIRGNGAPVFVVILAFLLVMRVGWKVFVACLAAFVVPLAAYGLIFFSEHGQLNITNSTGLFLWSRTMSFANCAVIKPPPSLVPLCPENQPGHPAAPAPAWSVPALLGERTPADYLWAPGAWYRVDAHPGVNAYNNKLAMQFAERAIAAQPLDYLGTVGKEVLETFFTTDRSTDYLAMQFTVTPHVNPEAAYMRYWENRYAHARSNTHVVQPWAYFMFLYQEPVWFPGWVFFLVMAGGLVLLIRRWRGRGRLRGPGLGRRRRQPGAADRGARTRLPVRDLRGPVRLPGPRPDVHPQASVRCLRCLRCRGCLRGLGFRPMDDTQWRTHRLELDDQTLREWDATVLAAGAEGIVLDRSAFYPGGGGQPPDHGVLLWGGVQTQIVDARKGDDLYLIPAEGDPLPAVGTSVRGALEDDRRTALMRTHSGLHVLCGVVFRDFGALVTGGNMEPLTARMDFNLPEVPPGFREAVEAACNTEVGADRRIDVRVLPRDEAFALPDIIRTATNLVPPEVKEVRIIDIVGLDQQADGGTHVASTRQVGRIEVVKIESKGKGFRRLRIRIAD